MKLQVTFEVDDDSTCRTPTGDELPMVDADHEMGVTEAGYNYLLSVLSFADDVEVEAVS